MLPPSFLPSFVVVVVVEDGPWYWIQNSPIDGASGKYPPPLFHALAS